MAVTVVARKLKKWKLMIISPVPVCSLNLRNHQTGKSSNDSLLLKNCVLPLVIRCWKAKFSLTLIIQHLFHSSASVAIQIRQLLHSTYRTCSQHSTHCNCKCPSCMMPLQKTLQRSSQINYTIESTANLYIINCRKPLNGDSPHSLFHTSHAI